MRLGVILPNVRIKSSLHGDRLMFQKMNSHEIHEQQFMNNNGSCVRGEESFAKRDLD